MKRIRVDAGQSEIPIIDISPYRRGDRAAIDEVVGQIDYACRQVGFFLLQGHGVPDQLTESARGQAQAFFALPDEVKRSTAMPVDRFRGYTAAGDLMVGASYGLDTPPDLRETFVVGPIHPPSDEAYIASAGQAFATNLWPTEPKGLRSAMCEYYVAMEHLALDLMRLFALALNLPEEWFDDKVDKHITPLAAQFYPPVSKEPLEGQIRSGIHTDFGSLTIVHRDDAPGGLEVLVNNCWVAVPNVLNSFTVNLGDLMAEWTNDRWLSTVHRVVLPRGPERATSRLALCFFHQPNYDANISVIPTCTDAGNPQRHAPITSGEHYNAKIRKMRRQDPPTCSIQ